jgi:hypothetical protein
LEIALTSEGRSPEIFEATLPYIDPKDSLAMNRNKSILRTSGTQPASAKFRAVLVITVAAVGLALFAPPPASAQKGGKPTEPPSPGTVLFEGPLKIGTESWSGAQWGMNADGSRKTIAFTHRFYSKPLPSALVYGTDPVLDRWWLTLEEVQPVVIGEFPAVYELFACRVDPEGNLQRVQLTALHPHVTISHPGFHPDVHFSWSNDGMDSFVSFRGRTYGLDDAETPPELQDPSDDLVHIFRLNLSGADIQAAFEQYSDPKIGIDGFTTGMIQSVLEYGDVAYPMGGTLAYHHWSPNSQRLTYVMPGELWVADCSSGPVTHGDSETRKIWTECRFPQWSPDGGRIALGHDGSVWTVKPDGSGATLVLGKTRSDSYAVPVWSPDSRQLAVVYRRDKGLDPEYFVARVAASGGTATVLTKEMEPSGEKRPTGWSMNIPFNP